MRYANIKHIHKTAKQLVESTTGKPCHTPLQERRQGVHLPSFRHEPVGGYITKSVTYGQYDTRPTVTCPSAESYRCLAGNKLHCLVTEAHMCK